MIGTMPRSTVSRVAQIALAPMAAATTIADLRAGELKTGKDQTVPENREVASIL